MALINGPDAPYSRGTVIHEIVASVARTDPGAVGLVHRGATMTYGELLSRSDDATARLAASGVGAGDVVLVVLARGFDWVVTLLSVLRRGAAYLAADPRWPDDRLREIAEVVRPAVSVTDGVHAARVPGPVLLTGESATASPPQPPVTVGGDDPGVIFLTSGSSGRPKLVQVPHRAVVRMFDECRFARFDRTAVMLQTSPIPWDAASMELWGPLVSGGTSVLAEGAHLEPAALREHIARDGVNTAFVTTSLFNVLVEEDVRAFAGLRVVMTGGEKLSVHHIRRFRRAHPGIRLLSAYGPVESTIFTTTHPITEADAAADAIPLGRPVNGTAVAVLDGDRPCATGEVGEICIAGDGLALGYLGDPGLTARKFVTLPLAGDNVRLYRSGDTGWLADDGVLHFVGRLDRQVKVRGHRIEPEEIERRLLDIPGVTRGVVVPVLDGSGACRSLAAFYTAAADGCDAEKVTAQLRASLPSYLVPDIVRRVERIPLTDTGKADRHRLLATLAAGGPAAAPVDAARGKVERAVAAEFAGVLGVAAVGRHDDFYASGGTSLDGIRLCIRLSERLGQPVSQSVLAAGPTVADISARLSSGPVTTDRTPPDGRRVSDASGVPLLPMQRAFWLGSMLEPGSAASQCVSLWHDVEVAPETLIAALTDVYGRHPALRARVVLGDPPEAVVDERAAPVEVAVLDRDGDLMQPMLRHLHQPFGLSHGPMFRAALAEQPDGRLMVGISVHHAFYDEWAEHLLVEELGMAIAARERGTTAPAFGRPAPTLSDVHERLHARRAAADLDAQRDYWRARLRAAPRLSMLAPDAPVTSTHDANPVTVHIDPVALGRLARRRGASLSHALMAALAASIRTVTGVDDIVLGVAVAMRGDPVLARAVTCLLNTVCVRLDEPAGDLAAGVDAVRTEMAAALSNQDVSVADSLGSSGAARGRPPYDVLFVLQPRPHPHLGSGRAEPLFQPTARELIAEVRPRPDGGLVLALLHAGHGDLRAVCERIADQFSRLTDPAVRA
uniref:Non-ribosomal peptide synthetase n=1 Tax=uncultured bacterium AB_9 TaxID=1630012 RepID=A0A0E3M3D3_9BACT|nr:non-ribosomal peptide synthetase [uncultured bacterium AB_9]